MSGAIFYRFPVGWLHCWEVESKWERNDRKLASRSDAGGKFTVVYWACRVLAHARVEKWASFIIYTLVLLVILYYKYPKSTIIRQGSDIMVCNKISLRRWTRKTQWVIRNVIIVVNSLANLLPRYHFIISAFRLSLLIVRHTVGHFLYRLFQAVSSSEACMLVLVHK